jgi:hypothetical protein
VNLRNLIVIVGLAAAGAGGGVALASSGTAPTPRHLDCPAGQIPVTTAAAGSTVAGCQPDRDGDGWADSIDPAPDTPGPDVDYLPPADRTAGPVQP